MAATGEIGQRWRAKNKSIQLRKFELADTRDLKEARALLWELALQATAPSHLAGFEMARPVNLYNHSLAPKTRRVRIFAAEKGIKLVSPSSTLGYLNLGLPRRHEPRTSLARPGQGAASARPARSGLRVVHGGIRHARSEGGDGVVRGVERVTHLQRSSRRSGVPWSANHQVAK
jgi:hypothetical protein